MRQGRRECQRGGSSIRHTYANELFMRFVREERDSY